jgi:RND family efflux transporter MFP subunit
MKVCMRTARRLVAALAACGITAAAAGCGTEPERVPEARPVRTVSVEDAAGGELVSFTGEIRARDQFNAAFRLDGRVTERSASLGDVVQAGEVIARLDAENEQNALRASEASLASARAVLTEARLTFDRQRGLLAGGWTSRAKFDAAEEALRTAQAQVESAEAAVRMARDRLGYTVLRAERAGAVTAVGAEPGEVVRAGQMIVQIAGPGELDAVFDIPEQLIRTGPRDPNVQLALSDDPHVEATGRVRQVAPQADPATRTFQVKVGIHEPPEAMRLGSTVVGRLRLAAPGGVELPASVLTQSEGRPAVWVVDPERGTVSLRAVEVARFDPARVVISRGLRNGERVVSAGVQMLRPGQKVRLLGEG